MGFEKPFGRLLIAFAAGVAKLAYAADSKSAGVHSPWGFKSPLRHPYVFRPTSLSSFQIVMASAVVVEMRLRHSR